MSSTFSSEVTSVPVRSDIHCQQANQQQAAGAAWKLLEQLTAERTHSCPLVTATPYYSNRNWKYKSTSKNGGLWEDFRSVSASREAKLVEGTCCYQATTKGVNHTLYRLGNSTNVHVNSEVTFLCDTVWKRILFIAKNTMIRVMT